jgi:hypothetical protein
VVGLHNFRLPRRVHSSLRSNKQSSKLCKRIDPQNKLRDWGWELAQASGSWPRGRQKRSDVLLFFSRADDVLGDTPEGIAEVRASLRQRALVQLNLVLIAEEVLNLRD